MSYNYEHKVNHTNGHTCELNSQTKESKPQAFKDKDGFQYYGSLHERKVFVQVRYVNRYMLKFPQEISPSLISITQKIFSFLSACLDKILRRLAAKFKNLSISCLSK